MKKHTGGLAKFLNNATQGSNGVRPRDAERIVYIDIDDIVANPRNFYGLRDIESLAGLIAVSHVVEPLTVCHYENGKYMLLSGHRRRAAVQKLLTDGDYEERMLPCIIRQRQKISIPQEDGGVIVFDENDVDMLQLIASNRGQRKERTMDEKLSEVKYLEPFARAIFAQKRQEQGAGMVFRKFFAEEILGISSSKLQRIESIGKMSENIKRAVQDGIISETAATQLTTLSADEQDEVLNWLAANQRKGTVQDVNDAIKSVLAVTTNDDETEDEVAKGDTVTADDNADDEKENSFEPSIVENDEDNDENPDNGSNSYQGNENGDSGNNDSEDISDIGERTVEESATNESSADITDQEKVADDTPTISTTDEQTGNYTTDNLTVNKTAAVTTNETKSFSQPPNSNASNEIIRSEPPKNTTPIPAARLMDIPDTFDNPQQEAEDWFRQERLAFYQAVYDQAKHLSENEPNERKAAQWAIRASVARYHIAELQERR